MEDLSAVSHAEAVAVFRHGVIGALTQAELELYDDAQSIYQRERFSFRSVGIRAQGRTTILRLNYRNTSEILQFTYHYAKDVLTPEDADEDGIPLFLPQSAGRHGPPPQVIALPNLSGELRYIAGHLQQLHSEGLRGEDRPRGGRHAGRR